MNSSSDNRIFNYSTVYLSMISITLSRAAPSAWILRSIGLDKSRLKIPMIDLASITYLPDTRSKSQSNLLISFTNAFTLSIELSENFCCFHCDITSLGLLVVCFTVLILPVGRIKVKVKKEQKMAAELVKMYQKNLQHYCVLVIFRGMLFVNEIYRKSGKCGTKSRIYMNSVHCGGVILHGVDGTSFGGKNGKKRLHYTILDVK